MVMSKIKVDKPEHEALNYLVEKAAAECKNFDFKTNFIQREWQMDKRTSLSIDMYIEVKTKPTEDAIIREPLVTVWGAVETIKTKDGPIEMSMENEEVRSALYDKLFKMLNPSQFLTK